MMNLEKKNENSYSLWDSFNDMFHDAFAKEMKTDIEETDTEYVLNVEVPGVKKEEVSVTFSDDTLTIEVKKEENKEDKDKNYLSKERSGLNMVRSYYLENVDETKVSAKLDNGILTLHLEKQKDIPNPKKVINIE
jgi:HSP20 family protein